MESLPTPHLLISVYLSPKGLNKYRLGYAYDQHDEHFRLSRFLTSCRSLMNNLWASVSINVELDKVWSHHTNHMVDILQDFFPQTPVRPQRLLLRHEWSEQAQQYVDDDVILLQTNDDHALVCQYPRVFDELCQYMRNNHQAGLGAITHHPEMQGLALRSADSRLVSDNLYTVQTSYAIGTTLVRGDLFRTWWRPGVISDQALIARPDNPIGPSIQFGVTELVIPRVEIMRHMDGYSHIGLFRPLAPLRNTVKFKVSGSPEWHDHWHIRPWPSRVFGFSGGPADLHLTQVDVSSSFSQRMRANVALLQAAWALHLTPNRTRQLLGLKSQSLSIVLSGVITTMTPSIVRNIPDFLADAIWKCLTAFERIITGESRAMPWGAWYLGWSRAIATRRHRRRMK